MNSWIQLLANVTVLAALSEPLTAANAMGRRAAPLQAKSRSAAKRGRHHHRVVQTLAGRMRARRASSFVVNRDGRSRLVTPMAMGFSGAPLMLDPQQVDQQQQQSNQNPTVQTQQNPRIRSTQNPTINTTVQGAPGAAGNSTSRSESSPSSATANVVITQPPPVQERFPERLGPPPPPPPWGGRISFGVVTGGALRDWYSTTQTGSTAFSDKTGKFLLGPTLQIYLSDSHRHVMEIDALRRGFGARSTSNIFGVGFSTNSTGSAWEIPVIFKRRFVMDRRPRHMQVHSFLGIGGAYRYLSQDYTIVSTNNAGSPTNSSQGSNTFGIPLAAGLEFRGRVFRFTPELRYTLWTADKSFTPIRTSGSYNANPNQVSLVFGFTVN